MWFVVAPEPLPDMNYWPGRRWLAAPDAVAWPALLALALGHIRAPVGIVGPVVIVLAALFALARLHRAVWVNHHYSFTTWRWAKVAAAIVLAGYLLKLPMAMSGVTSRTDLECRSQAV